MKVILSISFAHPRLNHEKDFDKILDFAWSPRINKMTIWLVINDCMFVK